MYISYSRILHFNSQDWLVSSKPSGIYTAMAKSMLTQFFNMLSHYKRVHVLRFDLRQDSYNENNKRITQFLDRLKYRFKKNKYNFVRIGYAWVREQETSDAQHYHFVMFFDGRVINYPKSILEIIGEVWYEMAGSSYVPKNCYYNVSRDNHSNWWKVIYRISYFAKATGKSKCPLQTKNYGTSRIKALKRL
ncbi:inovirus Gp2 family protein [Shewanella electrodiphila]|uniref:Inovirus Gp2 family protein n=1 Tax=Shewanella electrodiphila TaxID=934143 RepID=A0ABT0KVV2_9GAMM|nr:inovirus-type Gp2 protein [Shewanella electrodiphila]MCL1047525.1 inovirus Gp2 family protein [Shewanella electrodiphila]